MQRLHCGVDLGTTSVKVALVDESGRSLCVRARPTPRIADEGGVATSGVAIVSMVEDMVAEAWRAAGGGAPLRSIAVVGVGEDGLNVRNDLTPTGAALAWFDRRADVEASWLRNSRFADPKAGIAIGADRTAAKWLWTRRHRSHELLEAKHWLALTDYASAWWTRRPFMSATLAPRTACFDVYGRAWMTDLLAEVEAPPLPELLRAGDVVGPVIQGYLLECGAASHDTYVVAGGHDHPIAAYTLRRISPDARVDSMGTANLVYGEARGPAAPRLDPYLAFSLPPGGGDGIACLGVFEFSAAMAGTELGGDALRAFLAEPRLPGVPFVEASVLRRALEHAALYARRMMDAITEADAPTGPLYATGGWSRSTALIELRASAYGAPIFVIDEPELTAVGAACLGIAAMTGNAPDLSQTRQVRQIDPLDAWARVYEAAYPDFRTTLDAQMQSGRS